MDRRKALKNIGLGAGFLVATPSIISLLQSCSSEPEFNPVFLSEGEGHALRKMVDLIIPSEGDAPGAAELGIHNFIDSFWNSVLSAEEQAHIKTAFRMLAGEFRTSFEEELIDGKSSEFDAVLAKYLTSDKEQQQLWKEDMNTFYTAFTEDNTVEPDVEANIFSLLNSIRETTIWGWKTSREIGKNVLWYEPIPGKFQGCVPLSEAGNGNEMAL